MKKLNKNILETGVKKRITNDIAEGKVSGAAVCVMQNNALIYKECFGYKNIDTKEKLTEDVIYRMASMTKPVTAVCILILQEQKKLAITDFVSKYLPGFKSMNIGSLDEAGKLQIVGKAKGQITIEQLLTHSSGLGSMHAGVSQMDKMTAGDKTSLSSVVKYYENMTLDFEPGIRDCYSAVAGFDVLARIVEVVSGMSFADFADKYVFKPIGMENTTFTPTDEQWKRIIEMSDRKDGKMVNANMPKCIFRDFPPTYTCGGAGMVSCIEDYSKFAEMLLAGGIYNGSRILTEDSIKDMQTPRVPFGDYKAFEKWGLGVRVNKNGFYKGLYEGAYGWSGAYGTHFFVDPVNKITAVYMKNSLYDGGSGAQTAVDFEEAVYAALTE